MRKFIIFVLILSSFSCSYNRTLLKDNNKYVRNQINYLKKETDIFLAKPEQISFKEDLLKYIREYIEYNFLNGREGPVLLSPFIIDDDRVIAFVAMRSKDNANHDVEYVKFISAKIENNSWIFGVKLGHVYSFYYADESFPRLIDEELAQETMSNLMLQGFFKDNLEDKSIFKSTWYVF